MEYAYVNGPMIRSLRTDLGLSQEDLASCRGEAQHDQSDGGVSSRTRPQPPLLPKLPTP